ncbi:MAG: hypothetical protein ACE5DO_09650, partial [Desulfobacterales bacterium]
MSFAPLSETIAWDNIRTLSNFTVGDKPLVDSKTGKLSIEDRSLFVSFRRYLANAFNPEIIRLTFEKAVKTIEDKKVNSATELENVEIAMIDQELLPVFHKALEGLDRLQKTYEDENKAPVAERLGTIATE